MCRGDGKNSIYWANRAIYYENYGSYTPIDLLIVTLEGMVYHKKHSCHKPSIDNLHRYYLYLSWAYEMNGETRKALERYQSNDPLTRGSDLDIARTLHKTGYPSKAFEKYCEYYQEVAERCVCGLKDETAQDIYAEIQCHHIINDSRYFRPFWTFRDFYEFMNKEYEKRGKPEEYVSVMLLFYRVDSQADQFVFRY